MISSPDFMYCVLTMCSVHIALCWTGTSGAYRDDSVYLDQCAQRIAMLQRVAFSEGMNCYVSQATLCFHIQSELAAVPAADLRWRPTLPFWLCRECYFDIQPFLSHLFWVSLLLH